MPSPSSSWSRVEPNPRIELSEGGCGRKPPGVPGFLRHTWKPPGHPTAQCGLAGQRPGGEWGAAASWPHNYTGSPGARRARPQRGGHSPTCLAQGTWEVTALWALLSPTRRAVGFPRLVPLCPPCAVCKWGLGAQGLPWSTQTQVNTPAKGPQSGQLSSPRTSWMPSYAQRAPGDSQQPVLSSVSPPGCHTPALTLCGCASSQDRPQHRLPPAACRACLPSGKACCMRSLELDVGCGSSRLAVHSAP